MFADTLRFAQGRSRGTHAGFTCTFSRLLKSFRHRRTTTRPSARFRKRLRLVVRVFPGRIWWSQGGSNSRPPACKAGALPAELWPLNIAMVGLGGFEPPTSPLSGVRSNQLSYRPAFVRPGLSPPQPDGSGGRPWALGIRSSNGCGRSHQGEFA